MALNYDSIRTVTISLGQYRSYIQKLYRYRMLQKEGFFSIAGEAGEYLETCGDNEDAIKEAVLDNYYNHHLFKDADYNNRKDSYITITRDRFRELIIVEKKIDLINRWAIGGSYYIKEGSVSQDIYNKVEAIYFPIKFHGQPAYNKRPPFLEFMAKETESDTVELQEPDVNPETEELVQKFIALGGKEWVQGSKRRIYFNSDFLADLTLLRLSNYARFYFDVPTMKFMATDMKDEAKLEISRAIMEQLGTPRLLKRFILVDIETDTVMGDVEALNPHEAIEDYRRSEQQREECYVQVTSTHGAPAGGYVVYEALKERKELEFDKPDLVRKECLQAGVFAVDTGHIDRVYIVESEDNDQKKRVKTLMKSSYEDVFLVDDKVYLQKRFPFDGNA